MFSYIVKCGESYSYHNLGCVGMVRKCDGDLEHVFTEISMDSESMSLSHTVHNLLFFRDPVH